MAVDDFGRFLSAPMAPPLLEATLEITHESLMTDPLPQYTSFVELKAEADCALAFSNALGKDPVANPNFHFVSAGERLYYGVQPNTKIAVIEVIES